MLCPSRYFNPADIAECGTVASKPLSIATAVLNGFRPCMAGCCAECWGALGMC